ncbi:MAG TPA: hypothetical protein VL049_00315 [Candidatus Dormibacteraeota bacterium]|nr:hypothetical protein [Candidatus Dormibacteraeota bacterium]
MLRELERTTRQLERKEQRVIPRVFHYRGERFTSYYKGWYGACERAGIPKGELRPHDFRRTAARAYTRAGIGEQGCDEDHGPQDARDVRPLQHHRRTRPR